MHRHSAASDNQLPLSIMSSPTVNGVHFVGSVPVSTEEDCFRTLCAAVRGRIKRIPDGEPASRQHFIRWQLDVFKRDPRAINYAYIPANPKTYSDKEADEIITSLGDLETRYDEYALSSYAAFKKLKTDGIIPQDVHFQVCLPTPANVVMLCVHPSLYSKVEPLYGKALLRSLKRIRDNIPHHELTIQFDCPMEIGMLERGNFYGLIELKPWFEPMLDGILERLARMAESVDEDVELGFHFCYGEMIQ